MNFGRYPGTVDEVVAVELPHEPGSFDAVGASLVLCSVPHPERAIAELRRVLKPQGELRSIADAVACALE